MRWLQITLVALAMFAFIGGPAEARHRREVRRITSIDPVTGVRTTTIIKSDRLHPRGHAWGRRRNLGVLGAPVIARRGFPRFPSNGERVWRAGRLWRFDAGLGQWIIIR